MSFVLSKQISELKAQLTEIRSEFQQQVLDLKATKQVDCKRELLVARVLKPCQMGLPTHSSLFRVDGV